MSPTGAWLALSLLFAPSLAWAQDGTERARELYNNGVRLHDEGLYEEAILAWQESYELSRQPLLLYNIGNAYERLGRLEDAIGHLNRYRAYAPADEAAPLERRITNMERRIGAAPPLPEPPTRPDPPEVPPLPEAPPPPERLQPPVEPEPRGGVDAVSLALLGSSAVGLGVGTVFGVQSSSARARAAEHCVSGDGGLLCTSDAQPWLDKSRVSGVVADVGLAVGLIGAVTGSIVLLTGPQEPLQVGVGPGRVWVRGAFR